jgi:hypothetical protein
MPVSVRLSIGALALTFIATANAAPTNRTLKSGGLDGKALAAPDVVRAAQTTMGDLPHRFEENRGQFAPEVRYVARANGYEMYLTDTETVMVLYKARGREPKDGMDYTTLRMTVRGSQLPKGWEQGKQLPGVSNYFRGNDPSAWRRNVPAYESVTAKQIQPGVDLVWYGKDRKLEYDLVVAPGVDPSTLEVAWNGARTMSVDKAGNLVLDTAFGQVVQQRPYVYQMVDGKQVKIEARYSLRPNAGARFELARYDRSKPLVIDPAVMVYSTFVGTQPTSGRSVVADSAGNVYLLGQSYSAAFPFVTPFRTGQALGENFLAKFNAAGTALLYATYLGGGGEDTPYGLAVDSTGAAYVLGSTQSTDFPVRNAIQSVRATTNPLSGDTTLTKFTPAGNDIVYSTYYGATDGTLPASLSLAADGSVYFATYLAGTLNTLPAPLVLNAAAARSLIAKVRPAGNALEWVTQLGDVVVSDLTSDATGIYFAGDNRTGRQILPAISAPPGLVQNRNDDGVAGKLNLTGTALLYYTHLGGNQYDQIDAVAVDSTGALYVGGTTKSPDLPVQTPLRSYSAPPGGGNFQDGFVMKLSPAGNSLVYSTYIGGSGDDFIFDIGVDSTGGLALVGNTLSTDIPQVDSLQTTVRGEQEAFVMKLKPAGNALDFSTYLGGTAADLGYGIFAGTGGSLYVTGVTAGPAFPTVNAFQSAQPGGFIAFLTKYTLTAPSQTPTVTALSPISTSGTQQTFTFSFSDPDGAADLGVVNVLINNFLNGAGACYIAYDRPSNSLFLVNDAGDNLTALALNGSGSTANSQCTILGTGSSASVSGNTLTLTLVIQFNATNFSGRKVIYMAARDSVQNNSGWQPMGTYAVGTTPAANPMVVSLTPNSGAGNSATLSVVYRDATSAGNLLATQILINNALDGAGACYVPHFVSGNLLLLVPDNGDGNQATAMSLTGGGTLENSQCRVESVGSSRSFSGNTLTLTIRLTFKTPFNGRKIIYGGVQTGAGGNSGWHAMGAWVVQ